MNLWTASQDAKRELLAMKRHTEIIVNSAVHTQISLLEDFGQSKLNSFT